MTATVQQECKAGVDSLLRSQRGGVPMFSPSPAPLAPIAKGGTQ